MYQAIAVSLAELKSQDPAQQDSAFQSLLGATHSPVDWAYDVWDELVTLLKTGDNRQRAIAAQVLCNLAKSDPRERMLKDLAVLIATTKDERFVTALKKRFQECAAEKNCTLIRYDILECLRRVYDTVADDTLRSTALALIETEPDAKYKKKYLTLWRR